MAPVQPVETVKNPLYVHFYVHNTMLGNARPVNRPGGYQTAPSSPKRTYTHHCKPAAPSSLCWRPPAQALAIQRAPRFPARTRPDSACRPRGPARTVDRLTGSAPGTTLPGMSNASMAFLCTIASEGGVRRRRISLPLIPALVDNLKYFLPGDLPEARGEELRPMCRPKAGKLLAALPVKSADRSPGRPRSSRKFEDELVRTLGAPG